MPDEFKLGDAIIEVRARTEKFLADVQSAASELGGKLGPISQRVSAGISKGFSVASGAIAAAGAAATVTAAAVGGLVKRVTNLADEAGKTAEKLGIGVEFLGEMRHAADLAGVASGALEKSIQGLSRRASEALSGNKEYAQSFADLGVSLTDAQGQLKPTEELMLELADAFSELEDGPGKVALAMDVFGRSGSEMLTLLNQGSDALREQAQEARELGLVFSQDTAAAAARLNDAQTRLQGIVSGIANTLAVELIPRAADAAEQFQTWLQSNRDLIEQRLDQVVTRVGEAFETLKASLELLAPVAQRTLEALGKVKDLYLEITGLGDLIDAQKQANEIREVGGAAAAAALELAEVGRQLDELKRREGLLAKSAERTGIESPQLKEVRAEIERLTEAQKRLREEAKPTAKATGEVADEIEEVGESAGTAGGTVRRVFTPSVKDAGDATKEAAARIRELDDRLNALKLDELADDVREAFEELDRSTQETLGQNLSRVLDDIAEQYAEQIRLLDERTQAAIDAAEAEGRGIEEVARIRAVADAERAQLERRQEQATDDAKDRARELGEVLREEAERTRIELDTLGRVVEGLSENLSRGFSSLLADAIVTGDFSDFEDSIESLIAGSFASAIEELIASELLKPLFQRLFAGSLGGIDIFGGLGGIFGSAAASGTGAAAAAAGGAAVTGSSSLFGLGSTGASTGAATGATAAAGAGAGLSPALPIIAAGVLGIEGLKDLSRGGTKTGEGLIKLGAAIFPPAAVVGLVLEAFGFGETSTRKKIAQRVREEIADTLSDADVSSAVGKGFASIGVEPSDSLIETLTGGSRLGVKIKDKLRQEGESLRDFAERLRTDFGIENEAFLRDISKKGASTSSIDPSDALKLFFPELGSDVQGELRNSLKAIGAEFADQAGKVGAEATTFANNVGAGFVSLASDLGLTETEFKALLSTIETDLGVSGGFVGALDNLNAKLQDGLGKDGFAGLLDQLDQRLETLTGKQLDAGNITDLFVQSGLEAETFVGELERIGGASPEIAKLVSELDPLVGKLPEAAEASAELADKLGEAGDAVDPSVYDAIHRGLTDSANSAGDLARGLTDPATGAYGDTAQQLADDFQSKVTEQHRVIRDDLNPAIDETGTKATEAFGAATRAAQSYRGAIDDIPRVVVTKVRVEYEGGPPPGGGGDDPPDDNSGRGFFDGKLTSVFSDAAARTAPAVASSFDRPIAAVADPTRTSPPQVEVHFTAGTRLVSADEQVRRSALVAIEEAQSSGELAVTVDGRRADVRVHPG